MASYIEKFVITYRGVTILLKFNYTTLETQIGGFAKHRMYIEDFLRTYWLMPTLPDWKISARCRIKYEFRCIPQNYRDAMERIHGAEGVILEMVRKQGRM